MKQEQFCKKIEGSYKYVYSLIPKEIWEWIYRNCVENNKKEIL